MEINRGWIRRVQEILAGLEKTIRARAIRPRYQQAGYPPDTNCREGSRCY